MLVQNYVSEPSKQDSKQKLDSKASKDGKKKQESKKDGHGTPHVKPIDKLVNKNNRTLEDCHPITHSNLDPLPYMEYAENDEDMLADLDGNKGDGKVRRQISD
jgi:hypothetical protein